MSKLVFLDCETTSLRRDCRIWEIGAIERRPGSDFGEDRPRDIPHQWFVRLADLNLGEADPFSLDIGKFYQRHPQIVSGLLGGEYLHGDLPEGAVLGSEAEVMAEVERVCRGAHIVGNVVNFDTQRLDARMAACGILWNAHYHLIDAEALAVGYLHGLAAAARAAEDAGWAALGFVPSMPGLPWDSEKLSETLGVKAPVEDRHTALGDARWARAVHDKVLGIE